MPPTRCLHQPPQILYLVEWSTQQRATRTHETTQQQQQQPQQQLHLQQQQQQQQQARTDTALLYDLTGEQRQRLGY